MIYWTNCSVKNSVVSLQNIRVHGTPACFFGQNFRPDVPSQDGAVPRTGILGSIDCPCCGLQVSQTKHFLNDYEAFSY